MVTYTYKEASGCVDYSATSNEVVSSEDARTMALIDIAAFLKRVGQHSHDTYKVIDEIGGVLVGIGQSLDRGHD